MPCDACRTSHLGYITAESQLPAAVKTLASRPQTRLAHWLDSQALRWCTACDRIFELRFDQRDAYYELSELPGALLPFLQGAGSIAVAVTLLREDYYAPKWIVAWLESADYDLPAAVNAIAVACAAPGATPRGIEALVRAWVRVCGRANREKRSIDIHLAAVEAAAARKDVFRTTGDAYVQKTIGELLDGFRERRPQATQDPLDLLAELREPPGNEDVVAVERALIELREHRLTSGKTLPAAHAAKLIAALKATSDWPEDPVPESFPAMVKRDVREFVDLQYRDHLFPLELQLEVTALLDPGALCLYSPATFCTSPDVAKRAASHCAHCATVRDGDAMLPRNLAQVFRSGWTEAKPPFVGGEWIVLLHNDRLAACPQCDSYFWLHGTTVRPDPGVTRLPSALRPLLVSPCRIDAVIELLAGPFYHAERLRGMRELAWRLIDAGHGY